VAAHAKVNLRLRVLGREASGYHSLETVFLRLALRDEVELRPGEPGIRLEIQEEPGPLSRLGGAGRSVPTGAGNLCWRAAEAYGRALGEAPALDILLRKRLPAGAGLGGGSADAAAVLRGLEVLHDGALGAVRLLAIAGELGSDVPFAVADAAAALGWERGRRLLPLPAPEPRPLLLLVPDFRVPTAEAFGWLDRAREAGEAGGPGRRGGPGAILLPSAERLANWEELAGLARNDFEDVLFDRHPRLRGWRDELAAAGARPALLSGSGSALFGVFADEDSRDAAAARLEDDEDLAVIRTRGPV